MIDLYYWPTQNGWKISIMLEECGLPYQMIPVNLGKGEQFKPEFLAISPNNRMPAIVDHDTESLAIFESGAILIYLAEKTGRFLPTDLPGRHHTLQWLMWQMSGFGPMAGQYGHFLLYAQDKVPYAIERFGKEVDRLYGVLDTQLGITGAYVAGPAYSIADIAIYPWARTYKMQQVALDKFPNVQRWFQNVSERPAVRRGLDLGRELRGPRTLPISEEARKTLFGQTAQSVRDSTHKTGDTQ